MADVTWTIKGREFANCNCAYGCPCQFNALPTHGHCFGLGAIEIETGHHGATRLDGLRAVAMYRFPGPIHEGKGEGAIVVDERATPAQRQALLRILGGQDTAPGATLFSVFAMMTEKLHDPVFAPIEFSVDVDARKARVAVPGMIEARGEPILNPVTGREHRVRIDMPEGFEYALAEIGRGWANATAPLQLQLADTYGQFADIHLCQSGVVR
jgi:hypothetical protein